MDQMQRIEAPLRAGANGRGYERDCFTASFNRVVRKGADTNGCSGRRLYRFQGQLFKAITGIRQEPFYMQTIIRFCHVGWVRAGSALIHLFKTTKP